MFPQGILVTANKVVTGDQDIQLLTLGACPSPVGIAIGGGGYGNLGGGGSGYVEYTTNWPREAYIKLAVHPGSQNPGSQSEDSYVRDLADNRDIVRGGRGQDAEGNGGAGEKITLRPLKD